MSKKSFITVLLIGLTLSCCCDEPIPVPEGRRLRDIVAENFPEGNVLIGATPPTATKNVPYEKMNLILDREFSYVTPENDFKQSTVHPDPDT